MSEQHNLSSLRSSPLQDLQLPERILCSFQPVHSLSMLICRPLLIGNKLKWMDSIRLSSLPETEPDCDFVLSLYLYSRRQDVSLHLLMLLNLSFVFIVDSMLCFFAFLLPKLPTMQFQSLRCACIFAQVVANISMEC